jgi:hypothetical protein
VEVAHQGFGSAVAGISGGAVISRNNAPVPYLPYLFLSVGRSVLFGDTAFYLDEVLIISSPNRIHSCTLS